MEVNCFLVGENVSVSTLMTDRDCAMQMREKDRLGPHEISLRVSVTNQHEHLNAHLLIDVVGELFSSIDKMFVSLSASIHQHLVGGRV
jgi:hypothetical protein